MSTENKYIYKLSQSCDYIIKALQVIKEAPNKAFEEDINDRLKAVDNITQYLQDVRRQLLYFKNSRGRGPNKTHLL